MEREALYKITELESEMNRVRNERDELLDQHQVKEEEVTTLRRMVKQHEQESQTRKSFLLEWENLTKTLPEGTSIADVSNLLATKSLSDLSPKTNGNAFPPSSQNKSISAPPPPPPPSPCKTLPTMVEDKIINFFCFF
jgi:formic-like protein